MKLFKITFLIVLMFLINSCNRKEGKVENLKVVESNPIEKFADKSKVVKELSQDSLQKKEVENSNDEDSIQGKDEAAAQSSNLSSQKAKNNENQSLEGQGTDSWIWKHIGIIFSISLNFILLLLLLYTIKHKNKYKWERDDILIGKEQYKSKFIQTQETLQRTQDEKNIISENNKVLNNKILSINNNRIHIPQSYDDKKSNEVVLDPNISTPSSTTVVTNPKVTLYAGKPSEVKTFTAVSDQQDEHKSIFRLTMENKEADRAQFEVVENEYIMKMIANSPDTYLYNACNPENSNQNFDGRILTTKKGIAYLVDGEWRVNDEDKATIKFQ